MNARLCFPVPVFASQFIIPYRDEKLFFRRKGNESRRIITRGTKITRTRRSRFHGNCRNSTEIINAVKSEWMAIKIGRRIVVGWYRYQRKYLFDFDGASEKLISSETIKSSAGNSSPSSFAKLYLSSPSPCPVQVNGDNDIKIHREIISPEKGRKWTKWGTKEKRKRQSDIAEHAGNSHRLVRIYYSSVERTTMECCPNEKTIHSGNKGNHGIALPRRREIWQRKAGLRSLRDHCRNTYRNAINSQIYFSISRRSSEKRSAAIVPSRSFHRGRYDSGNN